MIREYDERDVDVVVDVWYRASRVGHPFLSDDFFEIERAPEQGKSIGFIRLYLTRAVEST